MSIENPETRVMKWERFEIIIEKKKIEGGGGREGENEKKGTYDICYKVAKKRKLLQLQSQIEHNCQHRQGELMTIVFLLVHFKEKMKLEFIFM